MPQKTHLLLAFGEIIRDARKQMGISQEELADRAGVHRTYVGMIERGEKNVTLENISKLAKALGVSISSLFKDINEK